MKQLTFLLFTSSGSIQITAKWQEVNGTAIEKLGHTALDAQNTRHQHYFVVCGGNKLVTRAINYLNAQQHLAPTPESNGSPATGTCTGSNPLNLLGSCITQKNRCGLGGYPVELSTLQYAGFIVKI